MYRSEKKEKTLFRNLLLFLVLISSIDNFVSVIMYNKENLIIDISSNLLLSIFTIFFIFLVLKLKKNRLIIYISTLIFIAYNLFLIANNINLLNSLSIINVPNFVNKNLIDVIKWSKKK